MEQLTQLTLTQREFQAYTIKCVKDREGIYFVRFYPPDDEAYEFECKYDLNRFRLISSDRPMSDEQLQVIHDEVEEQYANDFSYEDLDEIESDYESFLT